MRPRSGCSLAPPPSASCVLAPGVLERLRVLFRRDYHIAAKGFALIKRQNSDGFEYVFIEGGFLTDNNNKRNRESRLALRESKMNLPVDSR